MLQKRMSLPNLRDSSFVFPGKLTVISRHRRPEEAVIDESGVFIRMGIDIAFFAIRASSMDSTIASIRVVTATVLGAFDTSSVGSISSWRTRGLGWAQERDSQGDEAVNERLGG